MMNLKLKSQWLPKRGEEKIELKKNTWADATSGYIILPRLNGELMPVHFLMFYIRNMKYMQYKNIYIYDCIYSLI